MGVRMGAAAGLSRSEKQGEYTPDFRGGKSVSLDDFPGQRSVAMLCPGKGWGQEARLAFPAFSFLRRFRRCHAARTGVAMKIEE